MVLDIIKEDIQTLLELDGRCKNILDIKAVLEGKKSIQKLEKKELEHLAELNKELSTIKEYLLKLVAHIQKAVEEEKASY